MKQFSSFFDHDEPDIIAAYRQKARDELGDAFEFPSFRYSSFVNMRLPAFSLSAIPKNPEVSVDVSSDKREAIEVTPGIAGLSEELFTTLVARFDGYHAKDGLDALHDAFLNHATIVKLPDNAVFDTPVKITLDSGSETIFSTLFIIGGKNTKAQLVINRKASSIEDSKYSSTEDSKYISTRTCILAQDGAHIDTIIVQGYDGSTVATERNVIIADKDAAVNTTEICIGGAYAKSDFYAELAGEGADSNMKVLYLTTGKQKHNIHTQSRHHAPNTTSDIVTKGVIADKAKALATGNVCIRENAFTSNGYETQSALLLSDTAEADAIPNLEIHNHDVKCSHGSTIGQLDKEQLF
ncbi:MAG: SufD family Fe-S cluster assembly protein, partial [Nanoarchaeota archaeon]